MALKEERGLQNSPNGLEEQQRPAEKNLLRGITEKHQLDRLLVLGGSLGDRVEQEIVEGRSKKIVCFGAQRRLQPKLHRR